MLLSGALLALFMTGFWLYCLTDAILTPASECRGVPKPAWIVIITLTFIGGAIAWLIARQPARNSSALPAPTPRWDPDRPDDLNDLGDDHFRTKRWTDADDAVARHPAGRARVAEGGRAATLRPHGPDDDPEFLRALDRAIRGNSQAGE
jgi:Phospholipase_D-nuclease N-terminal